jgi:hypothetical protein
MMTSGASYLSLLDSAVVVQAETGLEYLTLRITIPANTEQLRGCLVVLLVVYVSSGTASVN